MSVYRLQITPSVEGPSFDLAGLLERELRAAEHEWFLQAWGPGLGESGLPAFARPGTSDAGVPIPWEALAQALRAGEGPLDLEALAVLGDQPPPDPRGLSALLDREDPGLPSDAELALIRRSGGPWEVISRSEEPPALPPSAAQEITLSLSPGRSADPGPSRAVPPRGLVVALERSTLLLLVSVALAFLPGAIGVGIALLGAAIGLPGVVAASLLVSRATRRELRETQRAPWGARVEKVAPGLCLLAFLVLLVRSEGGGVPQRQPDGTWALSHHGQRGSTVSEAQARWIYGDALRTLLLAGVFVGCGVLSAHWDLPGPEDGEGPLPEPSGVER